MKSKKILKFGLPIIASTALAVSLPLTLTSCNSESSKLNFSINLNSQTKIAENSSTILQVYSEDVNANYQWLIKENKSDSQWKVIPNQTRNILHLSASQVKQYANKYEFACLIYNNDKTDYKLSNITQLSIQKATFTLNADNTNLYPDENSQYHLKVEVKDTEKLTRSNYEFSWYLYDDQNGIQSVQLFKQTSEPELTVNRNEISKTSYILCAATNPSTGETQILKENEIFTLNYKKAEFNDLNVQSRIVISSTSNTPARDNTTNIEITNFGLKDKLKNPEFKFELLKYDFKNSQFISAGELSASQTQPSNSTSISLELPDSIQDQDVYQIKVTAKQGQYSYATTTTNPFVTVQSNTEKLSVPNPIELTSFIENIKNWDNDQLSQTKWQAPAKQETKEVQYSDATQEGDGTGDGSIGGSQTQPETPNVEEIGVPTDSYKNSLLNSIGFSDEQIKTVNPTVQMKLTSEKKVGTKITIQLSIKLGNSFTWIDELVQALQTRFDKDNINLSEDKTTLNISSSTNTVYSDIQSEVTSENIKKLVTSATNWSSSNYINSKNIDANGQIIKPTSNGDSTEEKTSTSTTPSTPQPATLWEAITSTLWTSSVAKPSTSSDAGTSQPQESVNDVIDSMSLTPTTVVGAGENYKLTLEIRLKDNYTFDLSKIKNGESNIEVNNAKVLKIKNITVNYQYVADVTTTNSDVDTFISDLTNLTADKINNMFASWTDKNKSFVVNITSDWSKINDLLTEIDNSLKIKSNQIATITISTATNSNPTKSNQTLLNFEIQLNKNYKFNSSKIKNSTNVQLTNNDQTLKISNVSTNLVVSTEQTQN